ncbi:MAG: sigma-70 family RNA polymerase sigma factor, partial [bacterium]
LNKINRKAFNIILKSQDINTVNMSTTGLDRENPERSTQSVFIQKHINEALQKLSKKERTVFVLRHYNGLPLKEIAQQLNVRTGTIKSTLFRSLKKLQKELSFYREEILGENV